MNLSAETGLVLIKDRGAACRVRGEWGEVKLGERLEQ